MDHWTTRWKKSNSRSQDIYLGSPFRNFKNFNLHGWQVKQPNASHSQKLLKYTAKIQCFARQYRNVWRNIDSNSNLKVQLHFTGRMIRASSSPSNQYCNWLDNVSGLQNIHWSMLFSHKLLLPLISIVLESRSLLPLKPIILYSVSKIPNYLE